MLDLERLFYNLPTPVAEGEDGSLTFETAELRDHPGFFLGRTANGQAALLIETSNNQHTLPGVRLQALSIYHDAPCRVTTRGGAIEERKFTVLLNSSGDPALRRYFLALLAPMMLSLGTNPSPLRISEAITALTELFRTLAKPPRKSAQGLWAELHLIATAKDPVALGRAWHLAPNDRFDFNAGAQRLEVKCTSESSRRHHFSLEQVRPPEGADVLIVSVITASAANGASLQSMLDRAIRRLSANPELQSRVYQVTAETMGSALTSALTEAYDEQLGIESRRFIGAEKVPSVDTPPPEVSQVRFVADLSALGGESIESVRSRGGLFAAL